MTPPAKPPYTRLSLFYFFYFGTLGVLIPYWGLYLKALGFSVIEIGELLAILVGTKLVAPYLWGWIADHSGHRIGVVRLGSLLAMLAFLLVFFAGASYWAMAGVMLLFSFFWNAALPQFEATTMNHLGDENHRYSLVRSWGSIGFIAAVVLLGPIIDERGTAIILPVLSLAFAGIWLASMATPADDVPLQPHEDVPGIMSVIRRPEVMSLLAVCFLMQLSHGPYYAFFSIYLEEHGYSKALIGQLWALGVIAEVLVFLLMTWLMRRFGAARLLVVALVLTVLRWGLIAEFVDNAPVLIFAQTLHAASFGIYHAVSIWFIHKWFIGRLQGRGQALYSSISFGAGGAIGSAAGGYLWVSLGGQGTYWFASAVASVALVIALIGVRDRTQAIE